MLEKTSDLLKYFSLCLPHENEMIEKKQRDILHIFF